MPCSKVHKALTDDSPMLVHCSDGIGRSGTFCLVDMSIRRIAKGEAFALSCATIHHHSNPTRRYKGLVLIGGTVVVQLNCFLIGTPFEVLQ